MRDLVRVAPLQLGCVRRPVLDSPEEEPPEGAVRYRPPGWQAKGRPGAIEVAVGLDLDLVPVLVEGVGAGGASCRICWTRWCGCSSTLPRPSGMASPATLLPVHAETLSARPGSFTSGWPRKSRSSLPRHRGSEPTL